MLHNIAGIATIARLAVSSDFNYFDHPNNGLNRQKLTQSVLSQVKWADVMQAIHSGDGSLMPIADFGKYFE